MLLSSLVSTLQAYPLAEDVHVIEVRQFSAERFFVKIRANLPSAYRLQVRLYCNGDHIDYAYQLFSDTPVMRWDNKEEYPNLTTYPHHFHDVDGGVRESPLKGDPLADLEVVLSAVTAFLSRL